MTATLTRRSSAHLEHREWLALQRVEPDLAACTAHELLDRGGVLSGSMRYTRRGTRVILLGEQRTSPASVCGELLDHRLDQLLEQTQENVPPTAEQVETVLDMSGLDWARRDQSWAVLPSATLPREVRLTLLPDGVRLEALLADWDEIAPECETALAEFLVRAQASLCFARCEISPLQARIVSQARTATLDSDLLDALRGVTAGCQRLTREVEALLRPELARAYRAFHG